MSARDKIRELSDAWRTWWQAQGERDRRAMLLLAGIGLPLLLIGGLLLPAHHAREQALADRDEAAHLADWIRQEGPRLQGMAGSSRVSAADLPQRVQMLASGQGLTLERLEADPSGLRVAANNARIASVASFLQLCRDQGIKVLEAQITRDGNGGNQVRLRLGV